MKLSELEPTFIKIFDEKSWKMDVPISDCDGIQFLCPKCFQQNNGKIGTHAVVCFKPHVPDSVKPGPGRWSIFGTCFDDITLAAKSSSISIQGGCGAHFHIQTGEIKWA